MSFLLEELNDAGIPAVSYKRPPIRKEFFGITNEDGRYKIWEHNPEKIDVHTDSNFQQAVLNIEDSNDTIIENVISEVSLYKKYKDIPTLTDYFSRGSLINTLKENSKLVIPNTRLKLKDIKISSVKKDIDNDIYIHRVTGELQHIPKSSDSDRNLLIGYDETDLFISFLPKPVGSVIEAHEILKPKQAEKEGTIRQGEFFFMPASELDKKLCERAFKKYRVVNNIRRNGFDSAQGMKQLEAYSNHFASILLSINKNKYVIGMILDKRIGRHKPLILTDWHRVVRNKEITVRSINRKISRRREAIFD